MLNEVLEFNNPMSIGSRSRLDVIQFISHYIGEANMTEDDIVWTRVSGFEIATFGAFTPQCRIYFYPVGHGDVITSISFTKRFDKIVDALFAFCGNGHGSHHSCAVAISAILFSCIGAFADIIDGIDYYYTDKELRNAMIVDGCEHNVVEIPTLVTHYASGEDYTVDTITGYAPDAGHYGLSNLGACDLILPANIEYRYETAFANGENKSHYGYGYDCARSRFKSIFFRAMSQQCTNITMGATLILIIFPIQLSIILRGISHGQACRSIVVARLKLAQRRQKYHQQRNSFDSELIRLC